MRCNCDGRWLPKALAWPRPVRKRPASNNVAIGADERALREGGIRPKEDCQRPKFSRHADASAERKEVSKVQKKFVKEIFENSSSIYEFSEDYLNIFSAITSSGPAIVALIIEALSDGGLSGGLQKNLSEPTQVVVRDFSEVML